MHLLYDKTFVPEENFGCGFSKKRNIFTDQIAKLKFSIVAEIVDIFEVDRFTSVVFYIWFA